MGDINTNMNTTSIENVIPQQQDRKLTIITTDKEDINVNEEEEEDAIQTADFLHRKGKRQIKKELQPNDYSIDRNIDPELLLPCNLHPMGLKNTIFINPQGENNLNRGGTNYSNNMGKLPSFRNDPTQDATLTRIHTTVDRITKKKEKITKLPLLRNSLRKLTTPILPLKYKISEEFL